MHFILVLIFSLGLSAQTETPPKENNQDLRSSTQLFTLEDISSDRTYILERSPSLDHYLRLRKADEEVLRKLDSKTAKKLDADFAARFIKIQYEYPSGPEDCKKVFKLMMKGEVQSVCDKDEKKTQELSSMLQDLSKRFQ